MLRPRRRGDRRTESTAALHERTIDDGGDEREGSQGKRRALAGGDRAPCGAGGLRGERVRSGRTTELGVSFLLFGRFVVDAAAVLRTRVIALTVQTGGIVNDKDSAPPQPETLPEIPPSPEPIAMTSEDPSMSNSSAPISSDQMPSMPATGNMPTVQAADDSVLTVAAIALIAMAALGIVAIQIKNRRSQGSSMPPSLEFTKV